MQLQNLKFLEYELNLVTQKAQTILVGEKQ